MRRTLVLALSVLAAAALAALLAARAGGAPAGPEARPTPPVAIASAKGAAWLSAVSDRARNRVFVTWAVASATSPSTRVYVAASRDGGRTYERPRWVAHDDAAWQPVLRVDRTGRLWATWTHFDLDPDHLLDPKDEYSNPGWQRVAHSDDGGVTWSRPVDVPRRGRVLTAFGTLAVSPDGRTVTAIWLDYLFPADVGHDAATYLSATSRDGGRTFGATRRIVRAGCVCCEPFGFALQGRPAVAFRGWSRGTPKRAVRDIKVSLATRAGRWAQAEAVSDDRFLLEHCPSAGPVAVVDRRSRTHLAWWTGATGRAGYWYAIRTPGGTYSDPTLVERHPSAPSENNATLAMDGRGRFWTATVGHGDYTSSGKPDTSPNRIAVYAITTDRRVHRVPAAGTAGSYPQLAAVQGDIAQVWVDRGRILGRTLGVS